MNDYVEVRYSVLVPGGGFGGGSGFVRLELAAVGQWLQARLASGAIVAILAVVPTK